CSAPCCGWPARGSRRCAARAWRRSRARSPGRRVHRPPASVRWLAAAGAEPWSDEPPEVLHVLWRDRSIAKLDRLLAQLQHRLAEAPLAGFGQEVQLGKRLAEPAHQRPLAWQRRRLGNPAATV